MSESIGKRVKESEQERKPEKEQVNVANRQLRFMKKCILSMIYLMVVSTSGGYISPSLP